MGIIINIMETVLLRLSLRGFSMLLFVAFSGWQPVAAQVPAPELSEFLAPAVALSPEQIEELAGPILIETEFPVAMESEEGSGGPVPTSGFTIDTTDRDSVVVAYHRYYMASEEYAATMNWTGNVSTCNPGTVSASFQDDCLRRINYYRAQAGLPADIYFNATKNAKAREAALVMAYQGQLSHSPSIDFPGNPCLSANANEAAGSGNLALGSYGPGAIDRYMVDSGSNNGSAGHRRWLLYSRAQEMGQGSIPHNFTQVPAPPIVHNAADCTWVIGNFKAAPPARACAWPNEGFVPYQIVPKANEFFPRWSFSYPGANFGGATVTMTKGGGAVSLVKEPVGNGYGDNTIVWRPSGISSSAPASDTTYTVSISGVTGAPQSSFIYNVTLIDPYQLEDDIVVSGPANPVTGLNNAYTFNPVSEADGYHLRVSEPVDDVWLEGAETSPAPRIIDNTSGSYSLYTTVLSNGGSRSFHLTLPSFSEDGQNFVIDRKLVPSAFSQLQFVNRFRYVSLASALKAEISSDEGATWEALWTRNGDSNSSSGSSFTWETSWQSVAVSIPPEYAGQMVSIRFRFVHNNSAFFGSSDSLGCFVDDVRLTQGIELINESVSTLPGSATGFTFNPASAGTDYILEVEPEVAGHWFGYGPPLPVTSAAAINPNNLAAPLFSILGGEYPANQFNLSLTLSNPNEGGSSTIRYAVNGGSFSQYTGGTIPVARDNTVQAYCATTNPAQWTDSTTVSHTYTAAASPPPVPVITSPSLAEGAQGEPFSHAVAATNSPTYYAMGGQPAGVSINPLTGVITGSIPPGNYTGITVAVSNASGVAFQTLTIHIRTGYDSWVAENYPGLGAPGDDDDSDGVNNMIEVALAGMNPTVNDTGGTPAMTISGGNILMTISKSGVAGFDYILEGSTTLANGSWTTNGLTVVVDNATTLQVSRPINSGAECFFCRLRVVQNSDPTP